jgi:hypothetical protein
MFSKRALLILAVMIVFVTGIFFFISSSAETSIGDYTFRVEQGLSKNKIARKLASEDLIKSAMLFHLADFVYGTGKPIVPGSYKLRSGMSLKEVVNALHGEPWAKFIHIPPNISKLEIGNILADALNWDSLDRQFFANTYAGMQWMRYHEFIQDVFTREFSWNKTKKESFLTLSSLYYDKEFDFFKNTYVSGTYEVPTNSSRAQAAGILIDQYAELNSKDEVTKVTESLDDVAMFNIAQLIEEEMELMPDIVALPPLDLVVKKKDGKTHLAFTTSYWNKGRGSLEFVGDPKTRGLKEDVVRNVFQRIYKLDGDYRERPSGSFMWHQTHLHYHFSDFAIYELKPVDIGGADFKDGIQFKSTFCIRDSEPIDLSHPGAQRGASYSICGKERQGISPGWADSYYYTYVDQTFDITNAPSGTYTLRVIINPKDRFEEITKENNVGEVVISLDAARGKVEVLEERQYGI